MKWIQRVSKQYWQIKKQGSQLTWNVFLARLKELREEQEAET
jgi:hypothetical protein